MNDTDKLIAAIFAATMTAKDSTPTPGGFFGYYDACVAEIQAREVVEAAGKAASALVAQNKAWG